MVWGEFGRLPSSLNAFQFMSSSWLWNDARRAGGVAASLRDSQCGQSTKDNYFPYGKTVRCQNFSFNSGDIEISDRGPRTLRLWTRTADLLLLKLQGTQWHLSFRWQWIIFFFFFFFSVSTPQMLDDSAKTIYYLSETNISEDPVFYLPTLFGSCVRYPPETDCWHFKCTVRDEGFLLVNVLASFFWDLNYSGSQRGHYYLSRSSASGVGRHVSPVEFKPGFWDDSTATFVGDMKKRGQKSRLFSWNLNVVQPQRQVFHDLELFPRDFLQGLVFRSCLWM